MPLVCLWVCVAVSLPCDWLNNGLPRACHARVNRDRACVSRACVSPSLLGKRTNSSTMLWEELLRNSHFLIKFDSWLHYLSRPVVNVILILGFFNALLNRYSINPVRFHRFLSTVFHFHQQSITYFPILSDCCGKSLLTFEFRIFPQA